MNKILKLFLPMIALGAVFSAGAMDDERWNNGTGHLSGLGFAAYHAAQSIGSLDANAVQTGQIVGCIRNAIASTNGQKRTLVGELNSILVKEPVYATISTEEFLSRLNLDRDNVAAFFMYRDANGESPIAACVKGRNLGMLRLFTSICHDTWNHSVAGVPIVEHVIKNGLRDCFDILGYRALLFSETGDKDEAEVNCHDIHVASILGDDRAFCDCIRLAEEGEDLVNSSDAFGRTPLMLAARGNHLELVTRLIQNGADKYAKDTGWPFVLSDGLVSNPGRMALDWAKLYNSGDAAFEISQEMLIDGLPSVSGLDSSGE